MDFERAPLEKILSSPPANRWTDMHWYYFRKWGLLAACLPLLAGCQTQPRSVVESSAELHGTITYRERMLLPPEAEITVSLEDVSRMDVASTVLAQSSFAADGSPPYAFKLPYDPEALVAGHRYGLRVRIEHEGQLLFSNDTHIDPFAGTAGEPLAIVVRRAGGPSDAPRDPARMPPAALTNTYWKVLLIDQVAPVVPATQREIHLVLQDDGIARGHAGCNRFRGSFSQPAAGLSFGGLISTRMACAEGMDQEQRFLQALAATTGFQLEGDTLALIDAEGTRRLYFEAVYLP